MDFLIRKVDGLSKVTVWVAGAALILVSLVIGGDVIARKVFNVSLAGTDEIGGYVLAATCSWAFAYTLLRRAHIRIDSLAWLRKINLDQLDGLILKLSKKELEALKLDAPFLIKNRGRIWIELPKFIP